MEIKAAKNGSPTLVYNNKALHSLYNPEREAERFIEKSIEQGSFSENFPVIVVGAGLGYLTQSLLKRFPEVKILALFYERDIEDYYTSKYCNDNIETWSPQSDISLNNFIRNQIEEENLPYTSVIEWNASENIFPQRASNVKNILSSIFKTNQKNIIAMGAFGRRWLKNICMNLTRFCGDFTIERGNSPILITAPGPSLQSSLKRIIERREDFFLLALTSSMETLSSRNIIPDAVLSTDPGYYARLHYYNIPEGCPLFIPASGASDLQLKKTRPVFFSQNSLLEMSLEKRNPFFLRSETGTVTETALNIASKITTGPVYLAGQDFCFEDIKSHTLPHSFYTYLARESCRINPLIGQFYERAVKQAPQKEGVIRTGAALKDFALWLEEHPPSFHERIYRLNSSRVTISWMKDISWEEFPISPSEIRLPQFISNEQHPWSRRVLKEELKGMDQTIKGKKQGWERILYNLDTSRILQYKKALRENMSEQADVLLKESVCFVRQFLGDLISRYG